MKETTIMVEQETVMINGINRLVPRVVTFRDFAALAKRRGWTIDFLVDRFRGIIEEPKDFFERAVNCKWHGEYRGEVVIPFRSVLRLYSQEMAFQQQEKRRERFCACGCGNRVWDRKKWASTACRKRFQRRESQTVISASVSG